MSRVCAVLMLCAGALLACACSRDATVETPTRGGITWAASIEDARLEAEKSGGRVLLSFEAYWCPWSRLMKESLYADPAVIESLASFRCVALDADRDSALCDEYGVAVFPTVIVTDTYGVETARLVGYVPAPDFLGRLSEAPGTDRDVADMFRTEERLGHDPEFLLHLGDLLRDRGTCDAALIRYEKAAELARDKRGDLYEEALYALAECTMLARRYREAAERFRSFAAACSGSGRLEEAMILGALCFTQAGEPARAVDALTAYLRTYPGGTYAEFARNEVEELRTGRDRGR